MTQAMYLQGSHMVAFLLSITADTPEKPRLWQNLDVHLAISSLIHGYSAVTTSVGTGFVPAPFRNFVIVPQNLQLD